MRVVNKYNAEINWEAAVELMDDEICEQLAAEIAPCTEQEYFTAYEAAYEAAYGEEWALSAENPIY